MQSSLEQIGRIAQKLAGLGVDHHNVAQRAQRLVERIGAAQFYLAVLGEFKRGKSTLVNALLEQRILPSGVIPVTAVATEVRYGSPQVSVEFLDGRRQVVDEGSLADFVTETGNPQNQKKVARAIVSISSDLLAQGLVLVDTPGIASVNLHNTEVAFEALKDADGAIVVLSVDSPVSEDDMGLLNVLRDRGTRTFVVVNKVDHLAESEVSEVREFITSQLDRSFGSQMELFCVGARPALEAVLKGEMPGNTAGQFSSFRESLEAFIKDDLVEARLTSNAAELRRLGSELRDAVSLEQAATDLGLETLRTRVAEFRDAADRERKTQAEDEALLARATENLKVEIAEKLERHARQAPSSCMQRLQNLADKVPRRKLEDSLESEVERCIQDSFESFRLREAKEADDAWCIIANDFQSRAQERVDAVRRAASDLFDIHLPYAPIPTVAQEEEHFFYYFLHLDALGSRAVHYARLLLPARVFRRRALRAASQRMMDDFDKHAGRARWDLCQRLDHAALRFCSSMRAEVERAKETILSAATKAERQLSSNLAEQEEQRMRREVLSDLASEVKSAVG